MKLFRFGPIGCERPGVALSDGATSALRHLDVSAYRAGGATADFDEHFFAAGGIADLATWLGSHADACPTVDPDKVRLGAPVARPSKIIGVGLNYRDHAAETGSALPSEPKIFMKATTAICGVCDDVVIPRGSTHTDYEVELAVVIGKRARHVARDAAVAYIAGYTICNDYSERDWQKNRSGQFVKGKSSDTFAPLGPYLVPTAELDATALRLWLRVNGEERQDATTAELIFDVPTIVASISEYMTLLPGDVITTGTPSGVGLGMSPPCFLRAGDLVEYGIDGIGAARQQAVAAAD